MPRPLSAWHPAAAGKSAKKVPPSFLEVVDCLVDVLLRWNGPPPPEQAADKGELPQALRLAGTASGAAQAWATASPAGRGIDSWCVHALAASACTPAACRAPPQRQHLPTAARRPCPASHALLPDAAAAAAGAAGDGAAPGVVRPGEVRVVSNPDGTIDLVPTAAAAAAAAAKKAEEQAERDKVWGNRGTGAVPEPAWKKRSQASSAPGPTCAHYVCVMCKGRCAHGLR